MLPVLYTNNSPLARTTTGPTNRLSALFDDFFGPPLWSGMPLSMWQDEDAVHVEVDAPGLTTSDIELSVHDGALTIQGERKCGDRKADYDGRCYGRFVQ